MRRIRRAVVPLIAVGAGLSFAGAAQAAADIEGVWSFSGGQVAVQAQPDGTFKGIVIRVTRFAECPHPVGELMWDGVRATGDGSYWGAHQWFNTSDCSYIARGNTAFRVLATPEGQTFLRVCFSPPENPESQPKIAPDGTSTDVLRRCADSDLVSALAATPPKLANIATLPRQTKRGSCRRSRSLKLRLREPNADALSSVSIFVNGRRVERRNAQDAAGPLTLTHVPRGRARVRITAQTVLGHTITGQRTYRICRTKR